MTTQFVVTLGNVMAASLLGVAGPSDDDQLFRKVVAPIFESAVCSATATIHPKGVFRSPPWAVSYAAARVVRPSNQESPMRAC